MADIAMNIVVATVAERLSSLLIQEYGVLAEQANRVEWIERELRLMHPFLEHLERQRQNDEEDVNKWADELREVLRDAEDAIETFINKSVKGRGNMFFNVVTRLKFGKELQRIRQRILDVSLRRKSYLQDRNIDVVVETPVHGGESSSTTPDTIVTPTVRKLENILTQSFLTRWKVIDIVKQGLCNFTQVAVEDFIDTRERWYSKIDMLKGLLSPFVAYRCQTKLEKKMKIIETQIGDAYNRRSSYGFEEYAEDEKGEMKSTSRVHPLKTRMRFLNWRTILAAMFFNFLVCLILWFDDMETLLIIMAFPLLVKCIVEFAATCCLDLGQDMQSIQRDTRLMRALTIDSESGEGLNERQRIWVEQIKVVAQQGEALCAAYELRKPHAANLVIRHSLGKKINYMLDKIGNVLERKIIYGIANIEERKGLVSLGQSTQGSEINSGSHEIMTEQKDNCGTEEHPPSSLQHMNHDYHSVNGLKEKVQSIREELQLMNALFKDVQEMEQQEQLDRRVRIWVDQMRESFSMVQRLRQRMHPSLLVKESSIIGFDDDIDVLRAQLLSNEERLCVTSIVGIGGTGKTTIARFIFNNDAVVDHFHYRVWVSVPRNYVLELLLEDIAKQIMGVREIKWNAKEELTQILNRVLANKRYLIVVDDVQTSLWDSLKKAIPDMSTGCRVLLTSRSLNEVPKSPRTFVHHLHLLNDEDSWRCLFYFVLFPAGFVIPARRLIVLWVAEDLVHQGENEESSENVAERYLTELIDLNMVQIIKRKHNGKVKSCRLPYALRELWLTKAEEYKFLQGHIDTNSDSSPKTCIIRRVADHLDQNDIYYSHIHGDTAAPSTTLRTYYKHVLSFLSFDAQEGSKPGEDIGNFLNRCISSNCFLLLRVLDLEHVYKPKLPKDIGRLSKLRYLGLRWTYLESLPSSIGNLLKLQTLDLKATNISSLPSSLWKMQLRHLYLSETYGSRFPPKPRGGSLSNIQTLWGLFLDEDSPVKDGLDRLVNIRKLGLVCQSLSLQQESMASQLDALAGWLLRLEHLQSLRLKSRNEEGQPWNLHLESFKDHKYLTDMYLLGRLSSPSLLSQFFPPSLIELTLAHSRLSEDPMQILNDLPNLRYLNLQAESYMGKTMLCCSGSFPQLRILKIWMLEQLEDWNIQQEALPCLRQLEIRSCQCLKMLPDGMQYVKALLELKLTSMPMQFKRRIEDSSSEDWHKIAHIPNISKNDSQ
ncbi:putative disease resistance RPP13-like protein 2 [Senna tora]|uniref:Putative disease resistance RPP13-like protein 2 n=1 Tax=Senna tora TaxID=362788 RepID=A0A834SXQ2_9FABA|nr:putative disease resistance RPP13-like protein 2 [Senna tora]